MNPTANKRRGSAWEAELAEHLRDRTGQNVQRIRLNGNADLGDMHLALPRGVAVVEAKNAKSNDLAGWCDEAAVEAANADVPHWAVVIRRRGQRDPGRAYVVLSLDEWLRQTGAS